ncbi:hydrogen gas-evolving membrane-bound hydrogenase subunit E [Halanaeroarchaeum sulfurireducens]|uniref:Na+/H+ antiporter MnhA subunit-related protein n=1 Tax=Halanaeroarchaeum sulfurireducens TaxID=1604004 RepID=A0A0N9MHN6_9EURY|nr:hydrogen gas-evolving membrane-bound hydrogenase subunit E [Halanaeroarchaeum sulfurireducens]ALG81710.1 Na+/H+ antiporter MnhA subunit-related protein [Halanaeroarchaeum sulfurireducens]
MQPNSAAIVVLVGLPFLAAAVAPIVYRYLGDRTAYFAAAIAFISLGLVSSQHGVHGEVVLPWIPSMGVTLRFYVDGLALLVGYLASGIGVLVFTYSASYMHGEPGKAKYYATMLAFMGSMLGVAFAADLLAIFVFWELTSISSFVLIGHYTDERDSRYAARKSMLITVGGGLFMLVGFLILASHAGTYDLVYMLEHADEVRSGLASAGLLWPVVGLLGIGAAAKSAQVPLHIWLPNAMEAPTTVSTFLHSATMVKAGVYLVGRFRPLLLSDEWMALFAALGLITMTVTAILAVSATDIKELLAYSTASHLGLIIAGFGFLHAYGAETGAFHILNHALFKAALFLVAGIVAHEAGTRAIDELGGMWRDLPITAGITVVAALGMAGVPPFNGFYSKELLFEAAYETAVHLGGLAWLYPAVAVFGSIFTFLYSIRFLQLFFGDRPDALGEVHSPPVTMIAPPLLLAVLAAIVGAMPQLAVDTLIQSVVGSATSGHAHAFHVGLPTSLTPPFVMSLIVMGTGVITYPFYGRIHAALNRLFEVVPPITANWWYDSIVYGVNRRSVQVAERVHNGLLRLYATWTFFGVAALTISGFVATTATLPAELPITLAPALILVLLVAVVAAVAITIAPSHVAGVLTLSILGFMVAIFYILASAPDLALTQLTIETLTLVIFLLVLDRLPAFYGEIDRMGAIRDGVLSIAVGMTVTVTVLLSTAATPTMKIAEYFVEEAIPQGGGGNIVNVILVDFRAFDTLGEISVIAMAALSVLTLVALRNGGETA